jgi:hypothetical protein
MHGYRRLKSAVACNGSLQQGDVALLCLDRSCQLNDLLFQQLLLFSQDGL